MEIEFYKITLAILTSIASGLVGSFALMRRMTLAGDAISHVALPGIAIAIILSINPVIGAGFALLIGALIVWKIESVSRLNIEAVVGVILALSLAVGEILINDEHELIELLFGSDSGITRNEFVLGSIVSVLIILFIIKKRYALTLSLISKEIAVTTGINTKILDLIFLIIFSLTVLLGLKFLGVLLMGSLLIIPAATSKNIALNLSTTLIASTLVSSASVILGMIIALFFGYSLGPSIVCVAGTLFFISLFFRK